MSDFKRGEIMRLFESPEAFEDWTDSRVLAAAAEASNFGSLVWALGSVYPVTLLDSLRRLGAAGRLDASLVRKYLDEAASELPANQVMPRSRGLPVPHPLDYDWRFAEDGINFLVEKHADSSEMLVCLGAPSIFSAALERNPQSACRLLDGNAELISVLQDATPPGSARHCDLLRDPVPSWRSQTVIADPPWYPEHVRAFLWCGRELLRVGGRLYLSLPPEGTRPNVAGETEDAIVWARSLGLIKVQTHKAAVRYVTPPFERNALRVQGIFGTPSVWRAGDILEFACTGLPPVLRPGGPVSASAWSELIKQGVRVRIARGEHRTEIDPRLIPLVPGDILSSVSRRDPRRGQARVWTSGNRVFGCADTFSLKAASTALVQRENPRDVVAAQLQRRLSTSESERLDEAVRQLTSIISTEFAEYGSEWQDAEQNR